MHAKDCYLALILGFVIAQNTCEWLSALGQRFGVGAAVEQAWVAVQDELTPHPPRPALPPHVRHSPSHE